MKLKVEKRMQVSVGWYVNQLGKEGIKVDERTMIEKLAKAKRARSIASVAVKHVPPSKPAYGRVPIKPVHRQLEVA